MMGVVAVSQHAHIFIQSRETAVKKHLVDIDLTGLWSNKEKAAFCLPMPDVDGVIPGIIPFPDHP
ncbi:MAG: hypothetical protein LBB76_10095 [Azoarcus sp.]|jgi:hypothetical protein|nr:hypothetical protein [Azoarcus sp.]